MDKDGDNYISIKDLFSFTGRKLELDQCKSIIEEALDYSVKHQALTSNNLNQTVSYQGVEGLKINFSNFKFVVLNQGQVCKNDMGAGAQGNPVQP